MALGGVVHWLAVQIVSLLGNGLKSSPCGDQAADQQHKEDVSRTVRALRSQLQEKAAEATGLEGKCSELRRKLADAGDAAEKLRGQLEGAQEQASEKLLGSRNEVNEARQGLRDAKLEAKKAQEAAAQHRDLAR